MQVKGNNTRYETKGLPKGPIPVFTKDELTPELVEQKVDEYFNTKDPSKIDVMVNGKPVSRNRIVYTLPGLCRYIGISSLSNFRRIMKDEKNIFSECLKKGYLYIQEYHEEQLILTNNSNPIFLLKQMEYTDQQTVNNISTDGSMSPAPAIISHSNEHDKDTASEVRKMIKDLERKEQVEIEK